MINDYLNSLDSDLATLKTNIETMGVPTVFSDNFTTLAPKVLQIPTGGGSDLKTEMQLIDTVCGLYIYPQRPYSAADYTDAEVQRVQNLCDILGRR